MRPSISEQLLRLVPLPAAPCDHLHDYTTRLRAPAQSIDVAATSRGAFARRPSLDLPAALAAGAEDQVLRDDGAGAFDVPAFLRRQSE